MGSRSSDDLTPPRLASQKMPDRGFLRRNLCFSLQRAALVISREFDDALRPIGLTGRQWFVLSAVAEHGSLRLSALAKLLAKDHATVTANLGPLARRGVIGSAVDPDDRRARMIALTPDGKRLLERAGDCVERFDAELAARVRCAGGSKSLCSALDTLLQCQGLGANPIETDHYAGPEVWHR